MMVARVWKKHGIQPHRTARCMASNDPVSSVCTSGPHLPTFDHRFPLPRYRDPDLGSRCLASRVTGVGQAEVVARLRRTSAPGR